MTEIVENIEALWKNFITISNPENYNGGLPESEYTFGGTDFPLELKKIHLISNGQKIYVPEVFILELENEKKQPVNFSFYFLSIRQIQETLESLKKQDTGAEYKSYQYCYPFGLENLNSFERFLSYNSNTGSIELMWKVRQEAGEPFLHAGFFYDSFIYADNLEDFIRKQTLRIDSHPVNFDQDETSEEDRRKEEDDIYRDDW